MNQTTQIQLFDFFERYKNLWQSQKESLPQAQFDEQWISPCQIGEVENQLIHWSPVKRESAIDLSNIEQALDITLHPSIVAFFCSAYSAGLPALYQDHPIELIQVTRQAFAMLDTVNHAVHPTGAFPTRRALSAGFGHIESRNSAQDFDHAGGFIHYHYRAGAKRRTGLLQ